MECNIPSPLKGEHEALHEELARATKVAGNIGEAARAVAQILHPHFVKEEEYALPPLGLLPRLAAGDVTPEMADVLALTERLKAELSQMLEEHKAIVAALSRDRVMPLAPSGTPLLTAIELFPMVGSM